MKSLHEMYTLLLMYYRDTMFCYICINIENLERYGKITIEEHDKLLDHFYSQYPTETLHPEYYNNIQFKNWGRELSWFGTNKDIRIKFLEKLVELTKDTEV